MNLLQAFSLSRPGISLPHDINYLLSSYLRFFLSSHCLLYFPFLFYLFSCFFILFLLRFLLPSFFHLSSQSSFSSLFPLHLLYLLPSTVLLYPYASSLNRHLSVLLFLSSFASPSSSFPLSFLSSS